MSDTDLLILGAGLAGLSAALHARGSYRLVERADRPGGLCKTDVRDGFSFDATGHCSTCATRTCSASRTRRSPAAG